jgi:hypothetical protein
VGKTTLPKLLRLLANNPCPVSSGGDSYFVFSTFLFKWQKTVTQPGKSIPEFSFPHIGQ